MNRILFKLSFLSLFVLAIASLGPMVSEANAKGGSFRNAGGHKTSGRVTVKTKGGKTTIRFSSSFRTDFGPDLFVYVGGSSPSKRIGRLRSRKGAQVYVVPKSIKPSSIRNVFVYCRAFSVKMGVARIR